MSSPLTQDQEDILKTVETMLDDACSVELECELLRRLVTSWDDHGKNQYKLVSCLEQIVSDHWAAKGPPL
jgi:hypothetical protein